MSCAASTSGIACEHLVDPAERAALIAGDERRHAQAGTRVAHVLFDECAGDGLHAGEHHRTGSRAVAIAQLVGLPVRSADVEIRHLGSPPRHLMGVLLLQACQGHA